MEILSGLIEWFADPANWSGRDAIPTRVIEHLLISLSALAVALLVAVPVGLYIGHTGKGAFLAVNLSNIGRAVPSFAVLVILFPVSIALTRGTSIDFTFPATLGAMTLLAIPPVVTNLYAGLREVDRDLIEAAQGMGMRDGQVLRQVEVPIALPVILAGVRTAAVQVVATATLGAVIGGGGLGRYIIQGITRFDDSRLLAGAVMVGVLAVGTELLFSVLQRLTISPGLGSRRPRSRAFTEVSQAPRVDVPLA